MAPRTPRTRKLLVASIGVATMSYVMNSCASSANPDAQADAATDARDTRTEDIPVANLVAPPVDAHDDRMQMEDIPVANLVAPPVDAAD